MKRWCVMLLLVVTSLQIVEPAFAARRVVVRRGPYRRTTVVVSRGWPLRRTRRVVVVRPARTVVRVVPVTYLPVVVFSGAVVAVTATAPPDAMAWEDSETLSRTEDWTEFTLNADSRGTRLWLEIASGKVQFDWAEVVFENGEARVVDFNEKTYGSGLYPLLDFRDGRMVDHVRLVAKSKTDEARVVLRMEK